MRRNGQLVTLDGGLEGLVAERVRPFLCVIPVLKRQDYLATFRHMRQPMTPVTRGIKTSMTAQY